MSTEVTAATSVSTADRRWGARSIASLLIFALATILMPIALVGHWGHRTVIDSQRYIDTVGPLIEIPEVQTAVAASVTKAVIAKADTQGKVEQGMAALGLPPALTSQLASPIASGLNTLIGDLIAKFVASDQFATIWIQLNTAAQKGLVAVLEGGQEGPVQVVGDNVVLDISSALATIQTYLVDNGVSAAATITVPQTDRQIVLMSSPALSQIRFLYTLTSPILQWFPLVIAAMFALSIALARRRPRTVVATGVVLVIVGGLLVISMGIGQASFVNQLSSTPFAAAAGLFWDTLFDYLVAGIQALLALGVVVIVAGWLAGRTAPARMARGQLVKGLGDISSRMPAGLEPLGATLRPIVGYVRWAIYLLAGLVLVFASMASISNVLWLSALTAGIVTVLQLLAGVGSPGAVTVTPSEEVTEIM
jgi:hypothetical protein